jgi:CRP/FNR family transcriptional regulator
MAGSFYILRTGSIRIYKASQEGRELLIKVMGPGDCICCAPLYGSKRHFVSAMTIEDSILILIPAEKFKEIILSKLNEIGSVVISCLCSRIEYLSALLSDLTFKDVEQRITTSLLRLAEEKAPHTLRTVLTLTHSDIAAMTGTVREVVSRTMAKLKREGIIIDSTVRGFTVDKGRLKALIGRRTAFP